MRPGRAASFVQGAVWPEGIRAAPRIPAGHGAEGPDKQPTGPSRPTRASIAVQIREDVAGHATLVGVAFLKH